MAVYCKAMNAQIEIKRIMHREFLNLQTKNPSFSLRAYARRLGLTPSAVSEIMNGDRSVTIKMAERILNRLFVSPKTIDGITKKLHFEKKGVKLKQNTDSFTELTTANFHVISDWYHFAILSLSETSDFNSDPEWIAKRLNISKREAENAIKRLESLGMIERDEFNVLRPTGLQYKTTTEIRDLSLRKQHHQSLDLAIRSLDTDDIALRDITSITMAIDVEKLPEAKTIIADFRKSLARFLESGEKNQVYKMNIQLIPLTKETT